MSDLFGLWDHQQKAVTEIEQAWLSGVRSVCYQLGTGGGKSRIIRTIVDNHSMSKKVIYVIAHRSNLVKQLSDELTGAGIRHGIIQSGMPYIKYRVQVCSIQTLVNRIEKLPVPEIIILDEAHHSKAPTFLKIITAWSGAYILGVTATPRRPDGNPLHDIFNRLILGPTMRELIDDGYLAEYEYYAPDDVSMEGAHVRAGEYINSEVMERVDKKSIIGSAVEHYKKYADHLPAIASCANIAHAEHVAAQFSEAGYKAMAIHSKMDDREIMRGIQGLKSGAVEILCQCELLGEGIDIPGAVALIGLRPTASEVIFLQHIGRVLRRSNGKKRAIILDHVGNWTRHGLPDDPRDWSLDGKEKRRETSGLKRCPECLRPVAVSTRVCPHCGFQWTETAESVPRIPEERDGELVQINGGGTRIAVDWRTMTDIIREGAFSFGDAVRIAAQYGYNNRKAWVIWTKMLGHSVYKGSK
jgi:superfamily II DNA or RNA helicase